MHTQCGMSQSDEFPGKTRQSSFSGITWKPGGIPAAHVGEMLTVAKRLALPNNAKKHDVSFLRGVRSSRGGDGRAGPGPARSAAGVLRAPAPEVERPPRAGAERAGAGALPRGGRG